MDYTSSPDYAVHPGTGYRMHQDTAAITTEVTAADMNQTSWSLMEVLHDAGLPGIAFDKNDPATYKRLLAALRLAGGGARFVNSIAELRNVPRTSQGRVVVTGYYAAGDGGGGVYVYDPADGATPDNWGSVIVGYDGGRWKLVVTGRVSPKQFGARANGVAVDTESINRCLAAHLYIDFGKEENHYLVDGVLGLRTGHDLVGGWAEIKQATPNTELFNFEDKSRIRARGLVFRGHGLDFAEGGGSDSSRAVAFYGGGTGGSDIEIIGNKFFGFTYTPVRCKSNAVVRFMLNYVEGPGDTVLVPIESFRCYGFLADAGCTDVVCSWNNISKTAQGVRLERVEGFAVDHNEIHDIIGQHGVYLGSGMRRGTADRNRISKVTLMGMKLQAQDTAGDNTDISMSHNEIWDCGDTGLLTCNGAGATAQVAKCRNITLLGNIIRKTVGSSMAVQNTIGFVVDGLISDDAGYSGLALSASQHGTIGSGVVIRNCGQSGLRDASPCTDIVLEGFQIRDPATKNQAGDNFGILLQSVTGWTVRNVTVSDSAAKMMRGFYGAGGDQTQLSLIGLQVLNSTEFALRLPDAQPLRAYRDNLLIGTSGPTFADPGLPQVASAAAITLPLNSEAYLLTGTAAVTSISPKGHSGRTVRLIFQSTASMTDGGNLKLAGSFSGSADDVMTITCDGTNWYEAGLRAQN